MAPRKLNLSSEKTTHRITHSFYFMLQSKYLHTPQRNWLEVLEKIQNSFKPSMMLALRHGELVRMTNSN